MGFWVETKTPKSWLIVTSSWWCTLLYSKLNIRLYLRKRLLYTVESGSKQFANPSGFLTSY